MSGYCATRPGSSRAGTTSQSGSRGLVGREAGHASVTCPALLKGLVDHHGTDAAGDHRCWHHRLRVITWTSPTAAKECVLLSSGATGGAWFDRAQGERVRKEANVALPKVQTVRADGRVGASNQAADENLSTST